MNTFLMVKKCSYCVSKVPNDDGPSMSIIEFCLSFLGSPGREALVGAIGLQPHFGHIWRVSRHFMILQWKRALLPRVFGLSPLDFDVRWVGSGR